MKGTGGDSLREYVVWEPILGSTEEDVARATRMVPDSRATHYWDADESLAADLSKILGLREPAWDVYLIYPAGATWDETGPPRPAFWMHQLGSRRRPRAEAPWLDGMVFVGHVEEALFRP